MRTLRLVQAVAGAVLLVAVGAAAQTVAPKKAPEGTTGLCKDGSYTTSGDRKGACSGHKGVKTWYTATRTQYQQQNSAGTNPPKSTPSTTPAASSPEPVASPAPK